MHGRFLSGDGFVWAVSIFHWSSAGTVIDTTTAITKNCIWLVILAGWARTTTTFIPAVIARYLYPVKFTNSLTDTVRLGFPQSRISLNWRRIEIIPLVLSQRTFLVVQNLVIFEIFKVFKVSVSRNRFHFWRAEDMIRVENCYASRIYEIKNDHSN